MKVDKESEKVTLPRIFLWYSDDFLTVEEELLRWVACLLPIERATDLLSSLDAKIKLAGSYECFDWNSAEDYFESST